MDIDIPPFYIGQKVVCINTIFTGRGMKPPLIKDKTYIVKSIIKCTCNSYKIDIGFLSGIGSSKCLCGHKTYSEKWHVRADRFKPLQEIKLPLMSYSKILEEELVGVN